MLILVTNDDGIDSAGLVALRQCLAKRHEVAVIAPDRNWSTSGHNRTMDRPIRVTEVTLKDGLPAWSMDGAPSDCVALAALGFLPRVPDLIISGINQGYNLGDDITYSGTVAAAMEGVINGIPAIAVSTDLKPAWRIDVGGAFIARLVEQILLQGLDKDILLNVNYPSLEHDEIKGVLITRLGRRVYQDELIEREDPRGRKYYWMGGNNVTNHPEEGTDVAAVEAGYVSVTPIHLDLTNHKIIATLQGWDLAF